jgi:hypothetical protein
VKNPKIIIWGHKLHTHTHSYIHNGYYKACKYLGYDVHWFDDNDNVLDFDFSNCVFITEMQVCRKIPFVDGSVYFIHNLEDKPFVNIKKSLLADKNPGCKIYDFIDYRKANIHVSYSELNFMEKNIAYHQNSNTFITMWATDMLPNEIDETSVVPFDSSKENIYWIGSFHGQATNIRKMLEVCQSRGKRFVFGGGDVHRNLTINGNKFFESEDNKRLVRESFISFDIREKIFLDVCKSYYPCRLFKSISYGKWCGSNMVSIADLFEDRVTFDSDIESLYEKIISDYQKCDEKKMRDNMNWVRDNHTYVSRIKNFLELV